MSCGGEKVLFLFSKPWGGDIILSDCDLQTSRPVCIGFDLVMFRGQSYTWFVKKAIRKRPGRRVPTNFIFNP